MKKEISNVAVIGAGDMGHGIAQAAILGGLTVYLYDVNKESIDRGVNRINQSLEKLRKKEKISEEELNEARSNLHPTLDFKEALSSASFVFEAVPEILDLKQKLFKQMGEVAPKTAILASNTSNMSITKIAEHVQNKDRVVGVHFFNPVILMELVEVIRGSETSDETIQTAYDLCLKMNKTPVRVEKDSPGFIVNRVNAPVSVFIEAIADAGIAEPEEIDALIKSHGKPMGHFELMDYVGLDIVYDSCQYNKEVLHPNYAPSRLLTEKVDKGDLGKKTGKGFYDWSNGRPSIDLNKKTDKIELNDILFVKLNEAAKLVEEGVATPKDIDLAMVLGTGDTVGPIESSRGFALSFITKRLESLSEELNKTVLKPAGILYKKPESIFY
ncbi:3-hydroxybutyryl-CoA dehydrogenase [Pueribacillus theae]|uniref:3-hydroxybutyryl-CoA dehydrogenase n=1 Tax=Pueribacillus theae TaxID=2171751 RepID=A0A2U1K211_9BACI|nr:3-hydroxyacyl-CoA dehydrogenase family protein [Pueribacillus theae]PWA11199.1 3-hydroxybutyryl-CoA dehydrogenase [Pueribacillus theae]